MGEPAEEINAEEELEVAAGDNSELEVELYDGSKVTVQRCKVKHAAKVARLANTVLIGLNINTMDGAATIQLDNPQTLINVVELAYNDLIIAVICLTSMDQDTIEEMEIDDLLTVLGKLIEINKDFFSKRVGAALENLLPPVPKEEEESPSN